MTNSDAVKRLCNAIVSTYYPDDRVLELVCLMNDLEPDSDAELYAPSIFNAAAKLVVGYVETSRSEGGISFSAEKERVFASLQFWAKQYGVDAEEFIESNLRVLEGGTSLW